MAELKEQQSVIPSEILIQTKIDPEIRPDLGFSRLCSGWQDRCSVFQVGPASGEVIGTCSTACPRKASPLCLCLLWKCPSGSDDQTSGAEIPTAPPPRLLRGSQLLSLWVQKKPQRKTLSKLR